jgi:hypothetical protein
MRMSDCSALAANVSSQAASSIYALKKAMATEAMMMQQLLEGMPAPRADSVALSPEAMALYAAQIATAG